MAAAPGGKATHLAAWMNGQGVLVTNEAVSRRASVLAMNLERMGVTHALITSQYPGQLYSLRMRTDVSESLELGGKQCA